jgi:hypothetical protein
MILKLFPQRPDHPLADSKEFKRILAEILVDRPVNAVEELRGWYQSLKHAENFRLDHYLDVIRQLDDAAQPHLRRLATGVKLPRSIACVCNGLSWIPRARAQRGSRARNPW